MDSDGRPLNRHAWLAATPLRGNGLHLVRSHLVSVIADNNLFGRKLGTFRGAGLGSRGSRVADVRNKFRCRGFVGSTGVMRCPNPVYSSHPRSRLVKRRPVPTAGEQCGCTMLRELARRVANASHSVVPSAHNNVLRSSNMKTLPRRAKAPG